MRAIKPIRFLVLGIAIAVLFCSAVRWLDRATPGYQTVPLVQGARSIGLALAGVAIDPKRHTVYAIVGGKETKTHTDEFVILWKATDGKNYCATVSDQGNRVELIGGSSSASGAPQLVNTMKRSEPLGAMIAALPPDSGFRAK
ncbi:MAG: hypothetical protein ACR2HH_14680 [Chthoniobacterales bacterium]